MNARDVERVAREYCRLIGVDPDTMIGHGAEPDANGFVPAVMCYSPRWQLIARRVEDEAAMRKAFDILKVGERPAPHPEETPDA